MKRLGDIVVFALTLLGVSCFAYGQTIPLAGFEPYEEYLRRNQLVGAVSAEVSFAQRPIQLTALDSLPAFWQRKNDWKLFSGVLDETLEVALLPVSTAVQYSSFMPHGRNDGAMLPAVGWQSILSGGVYARCKNWDLQLRPELRYAQNKTYEGFPDVHYESNWVRRYVFWNKIDQPEDFGSPDLWHFFPGQSHISYGNEWAVGVSTQNLWWGPSKRNALIMSNNAGGFAHAFAGTRKPLKTSIGSFEGQVLAGLLSGSQRTPPQPARRFYFSTIYHPKPNEKRYLSGLNLSWQPRWVPGLFIGASKTKQLYVGDLDRIRDFLPFFVPPIDPLAVADVRRSPSQQQSSVYMRWVFEADRSEIYAEYGTHGMRKKLRKWLEEPERNRGYTLGLSKLFSLSQENKFFQLQAEFTQLQQTQWRGIEAADSWYLSDEVRHGYTHRGEIIGASIGPGSNSQFLELSWVEGLKRISLQLERLVNQNDFIMFAFNDTGDFRRHWIDHTVGLHVDLPLKNLLLSSKLHYTRSINYQWELVTIPGAPWFRNGRDVNNWYGGLSVVYFFTE